MGIDGIIESNLYYSFFLCTSITLKWSFLCSNNLILITFTLEKSHQKQQRKEKQVYRSGIVPEEHKTERWTVLAWYKPYMTDSNYKHVTDGKYPLSEQ